MYFLFENYIWQKNGKNKILKQSGSGLNPGSFDCKAKIIAPDPN